MVRRDVVCGAVWLVLMRRGKVRCSVRFAVRRDAVCFGAARYGTVRYGVRVMRYAQSSAVRFVSVWRGTVRYAVQCGAVRCGIRYAVRCGAVRYAVWGAVRCGAMWRFAVLYRADRCGAAFGGNHRIVQCVGFILRTARLGMCQMFVR